MAKKVIEHQNAVDETVDTFQNTEAKEAWDLAEIACEEAGTKPLESGRKLSKGNLQFSIEDDEKADDVVTAFVGMELQAHVMSLKTVLLKRRAERIAEKTAASAAKIE